MTAFEQLKQKLHEIFQLDKRELDFGIYRIMNLKADEIASFIDNDLLPQVKGALENYTANDNKEIKEELNKAIENAKNLGIDPNASPKVKELQAKLTQSFDAEKIEVEIYSDLYNFFKRYYSEGDFISLRRYKEGVYALPYEGEEVKLHWANADQYYIKSSETLTNYTFKVGDNRIRFEVTDATTEQNNNKAKEERRFKLVENNPVRQENAEYIISFSYLPDDTKNKQEELNRQIEQALFQNAVLAPCVTALRAEKTTGKTKNSLLYKHLTDFTAKNTFDYFIHKNLGKFLRRELDFYIKNEMMYLDDIENENAPRVEQYLAKIKVFRKIAGKIITFLASLEDFQKKLWLKKKFVLETNYCITLDRVPEELYEEIAQNDAQREEWVKLFAINKITQDTTRVGYSEPLSIEFLKENPFLVLDTAFFSTEFKYKLLASIDHLDQQCNGLLIHSENFQALNMLQEKYHEKMQCIYIDPPFNTENDTDFLYKDKYKTSSWLSFMNGRMALGKQLLIPFGSMFLHLDRYANYYGRQLLDNLFGSDNFINEIIWRMGWVSGYKTQIDAYVRNHDTIFYYGKNDAKKTYFDKSNSKIPYHTYPFDEFSQDISNIIKKMQLSEEELRSFNLNILTKKGEAIRLYPSNKNDKQGAYHIEDTWNCSPYETIDSNKIKRNVAEYTPNGSKLTQKPEELLERIVSLSCPPKQFILDFFVGSGTSVATAHKMNRKWIGIEMGKYFDTDVLVRMKWVLFGKEVGISKKINWLGGGLFKYIRLESYEDALDNLSFTRTDTQKELFAENNALREEYILKYMMDLETKGSLLTVQDFSHPFDFTLNITRNSETKRVTVDLVETFNYLIGLEVRNIQKSRGVVSVEGITRTGEKTLVLWRNTSSMSNDALNEWFEKRSYSTKDKEFDVIYVNGDNNLENIRKDNETWKVRLTEAEFLKRMFEGQEA